MSLDIRIHSLHAGSQLLMRDLHLQIALGQITTLMGGSGSGKSTLLSVICGTAAPEVRFNGDILLNGQSILPLPCAQRRVGMLFQDDLLFAHMTVRQNLLFAVPAGERTQRETTVQAALEHLGFSSMAERNPATLSGGQRARVSLMRTLLAQPQALLLDEPFSKLDSSLRAQYRQWVFAHVHERGLPTLLVTHDSGDMADPASLIQLAPC
jgi:putative thiamine transport system ATP-binding protein